MIYQRKIVLLVALLFLTSCSGLKGPLTKSEIQSTRKVAVISLLGENFHGIRVATTVFGNIYYVTSVPDWNIDGITEDFIVSRVSSPGIRSALALAHDSALQKRFVKSWGFANNGFDYDELFALAKEQGADTLIVVQPTPYSNARFHRPGYGFYENTFMGGSRRCVYSLFTVDVFSVSSGDRLGWEWGLPCESGETEIAWKRGFLEYTEEEKERLREKTVASVISGVSNALKILGF